MGLIDYEEMPPTSRSPESVEFAAMVAQVVPDRAPAVGSATADLIEELASAMSRYPAMRSAHEGFALILEELDELRGAVWAKQGSRDVAAMRKEAIQVAAMALRFAVDVCDGERGQL